MNKAIPVFFVHRGAGNILKYAINQVSAFNPDSTITLLGDETNLFVKKYGANHIMLKDYFVAAEEFEKHYVNLSPNRADYECFCFQRWFIINEYVKSIGYEGRIFCLDSDSMIYCNLTEYNQRYLDGCDVTVCLKQGPQFTFITSEALNRFCEFIMAHYTQKDGFKKLQAYYNDRIQKRLYGGVSDMVLLEWFAKANRSIDTKVVRDGAMFDNLFRKSEGYMMDGRHKKAELEDGKYYGYALNGERVRFLGLHFQGRTKWIMHRYYTGNPKNVPPKFVAEFRLKKYKWQFKMWKKIKKKKLDVFLKKIFKISEPRA